MRLGSSVSSRGVVMLEDSDLWGGFVCPVCGKHYLPNGTGPTSMGLFSKILKGFPSELMVGGIPPRLHDCAYNLCPAGFIVRYRELKISTRKQADKGYLWLMLDAHKDARGLAKGMLHVVAWRNYKAVRIGGEPSYKHSHG
jgi:hypothetical protein